MCQTLWAGFHLVLPTPMRLLVIHCHVTEYCKDSNLKEYTCIIPQVPWVGVWAQLSWVFCSRSHKAAFKVSARLYAGLEARLGKNPFPSSLWMVGFISLQFVGPRFLTSCCLSAGSLPQLPKTGTASVLSLGCLLW